MNDRKLVGLSVLALALVTAFCLYARSLRTPCSCGHEHHNHTHEHSHQ